MRHDSRASRIQPLVESQAGDGVYFVDGGPELLGPGVFDPLFHRLPNRVGRLVPNRHDEREPEGVAIPLVQSLERLVLFRGQLIETGGGLFLDGGIRHLGLLAEVRMRSEEFESSLPVGVLDDAFHRRVEVVDGLEGAVVPRSLGYPRGVFVHAAEVLDELLPVGLVQRR